MQISRRSEIKKAFLEEYAKNGMVISKACQTAGVNRETFRNWTNPAKKSFDKDFTQAVDDIDESMIDIAESNVKDRIMKGEWIPTKYYLENRAPHRWKERAGSIPIELPGNSTINVRLTKVIDDGTTN